VYFFLGKVIVLPALYTPGTLLNAQFFRGTLQKNRDVPRKEKAPPWRVVPHKFWLFGAEGESARSEEEVLKDLKRRGVQRVRIFEPLTSQA